ncbi:hypothetical protein DUNSADRAFT_4882, partial [Dunaliella salina]
IASLKEETPQLAGIDSADPAQAAKAGAVSWEALHELVKNCWEAKYDQEYDLKSGDEKVGLCCVANRRTGHTRGRSQSK